MTEDKMVGWHHHSKDMSLSKLQGDGEGQGSLVSSGPQACKESDMTERLNNNNVELKEQVTEECTQCELDIYSSKDVKLNHEMQIAVSDHEF